jgi:hypothetical protein
MASETFSKTTLDFRMGITLNFIRYLEKAKQNKEEGWQDLIKEFNKTNKAGYILRDRDSGGIQLFDKKGGEIQRPLDKKPLTSPS